VIFLEDASVCSSRFIPAMDEPRGRNIAWVLQQRASVKYTQTDAPKCGKLVLKGSKGI
jgi:hypothetical protein